MKAPNGILALVGLGVACMASSTAFAQTVTYSAPPSASSGDGNSRTPRSGRLSAPDPTRDTPDSIHSYQVMLGFGDCAARLGEGTVSNILASAAESRTEQHDLVELQNRVSSCLRTGLPNVLSLQRGVLAEGLYKHTFDEAPALPSYGATKPEYEAFLELEKKRNRLRSENDQVMISATNCLVAQQPAIADRILRSEHGSDAEASAMDSIFAYAPKCAGSTRPDSLSRSYLRAFLADSMYHYTNWQTQQESAAKD